MRPAKRIPFALGLAAFALAFLQRPGEASSDTKIDLHVDPAGFLADVASLWAGTGDLGHVQGGQYAGYLLPMGPFFALGDVIGLSPWVIHRLWLGAILALAAWGMVRLVDEMHSSERGVAHLVAGALVLLNPYVVTFSNRTSVTLLGYAALPWLLVAASRGVRTPRRRWWWPTFFGVVVALTGGGVNAAVTAFLLIGPALLLLYMWRVLGVGGRDVWGFTWRAAVALVATSLWWILPVAFHARYGLDFLPFTEPAGAIWGTTSLTESLRLMGYWISYLGVGYGTAPVPYFTNVEPLLFSAAVVAATFLVPGLALAGLRWTHRRPYAPFFLLLLLVGLVVMTLGFPEGTPLRRLVDGGYHAVDPVQFLRTTYKAGPLVAVSIAWLGGAAAAAAWTRLRRPAARLVAVPATAALVALAAWPMVRGEAVDPLVTWDEIPAHWERAADDLETDLPPQSRALVLPGQLYAFYGWGATVDPILPALTERPVAVSTVPPYADLRAVDLLWTVDALVRQRRAVPGQLDPLLRLLGAAAVVVGTDDERVRSGAPDPAEAAAVLSSQGLGRPARAYGERSEFRPPVEEATARARLPAVRRYDVRGARRLVRVAPTRGTVVVDGSAEGLAALAAFGRLPSRAPIVYAADRRAAEIRQAALAGGSLVVTDTNRKRAYVPSRPRQNLGATLDAETDPPRSAAVLDPFGESGEDAQTVARLDGARAVRAPFSPGFPQFPELRPYAAVDGDPSTFWLADAQLDRDRHRLEVKLEWARTIPHLDLLPQRTGLTDVTAVEVNGRRFDVTGGWNRLRLGIRTDTLRIRIASVRRPKGYARGAGAIAELRIPGVRIRESLRPPQRIEAVARAYGLDDVPLTYLFSRASGDDPFRRSTPVAAERRGAGLENQPVEAALVARPGDAEGELRRSITPPSTRRFRAEAWLALAPDAPDPELDRLAGTATSARFTSSSRLHGLARHRASAAFDGDPRSGWATHVDPGARPWLGWRRPARRSIRRLQLRGLPGIDLPGRVAVRAGGGRAVALPVRRDGTIALPRPVSARTVRISVLAVRDDAPVVGIAEVYGARVPRARPRGADARVRGRCGDAWVATASRRVSLRAEGSVRALENGVPLRARACGRLVMRAGPEDVRSGARLFATEHLLLESGGDRTARAPVEGRVVDLGVAGRGRHHDVRVALRRPSWLVLGESFNSGWRASCDDRSLGKPTPIDGYANGWLAPADCRAVEFWFAPNSVITAGYVGSGAVLVLALLLLLLRRPDRVAPLEGRLPQPSRRRLAPRHAVIAAALAALPVAGLFGLRAGAVAFPGLAVLLWRGAGSRHLVVGAGLLAGGVVPLLYVAFPVENRNGVNPAYAAEQLEAHWVGVAAWVLLALALWRMLSTARRRSGGRGAASADEGASPGAA